VHRLSHCLVCTGGAKQRGSDERGISESGEYAANAKAHQLSKGKSGGERKQKMGAGLDFFHLGSNNLSKPRAIRLYLREGEGSHRLYSRIGERELLGIGKVNS